MNTHTHTFNLWKQSLLALAQLQFVSDWQLLSVSCGFINIHKTHSLWWLNAVIQYSMTPISEVNNSVGRRGRIPSALTDLQSTLIKAAFFKTPIWDHREALTLTLPHSEEYVFNNRSHTICCCCLSNFSQPHVCTGRNRQYPISPVRLKHCNLDQAGWNWERVKDKRRGRDWVLQDVYGIYSQIEPSALLTPAVTPGRLENQ